MTTKYNMVFYVLSLYGTKIISSLEIFIFINHPFLKGTFKLDMLASGYEG